MCVCVDSRKNEIKYVRQAQLYLVNDVLCCYMFRFRWDSNPRSQQASGLRPAEILGSNPTGGMDICLL